jgi:nitrogenase molybdenum-iron protein alpha/beta subunit
MVASTALETNFLSETGGRFDTYFADRTVLSFLSTAHEGVTAIAVNPRALFFINSLLDVISIF